MKVSASEIPMICISLDRRPDRWINVQHQAQNAGISLERLSAVDAATFGPEPHKHPAISLTTAHNVYYGQRRSHYEIDKAGAIGCSLSHYAAWEKLLSSGASAMVIFEDDVDIPPDFAVRFSQMMAEIPDDWDVIVFNNVRFPSNKRGCISAGDGSQWHFCNSLAGAHAYMVSRRGAKRLLTRAYPIELHVDAYMAFMSRMGHIQMLWHPILQLEQTGRDSDINHGSQGILDIPANLDQVGLSVLNTKSIVGIMAMSAVVGGLIAMAWRPGK